MFAPDDDYGVAQQRMGSESANKKGIDYETGAAAEAEATTSGTKGVSWSFHYILACVQCNSAAADAD